MIGVAHVVLEQRRVGHKESKRMGGEESGGQEERKRRLNRGSQGVVGVRIRVNLGSQRASKVVERKEVCEVFGGVGRR